MIELQEYKVNKLPDSAYYIPNFITTEEEENLLQKIYSSPKPKWKTLSNRRLQNWGGLPHPKGMIQEDLPEWLNKCLRKVAELEIFGDKTPNHVLVNEYLPGQGIMAHEDGPLFYPIIATLNLGSHTVLNYYEKLDTPDSAEEEEVMNNSCARYVGSLLLERCSLLVVQNDLYHRHLHGIEERTSDTLTENMRNLTSCHQSTGTTLDRGNRISITIRHVPHTVSAKRLFKIK